VFVQPSRVEGLSVALVEAMTLGVPCAVSGYVARSLDVERHGTALVLADDPAVAAYQLAALLADRPRARALGATAASHAAVEFAPTSVAAAHVAHYRRVRGAHAGASGVAST
jgi:glycosyltransferase involved in cell wall biosynthesis